MDLRRVDLVFPNCVSQQLQFSKCEHFKLHLFSPTISKMCAKPVLYYMAYSPPCRSVLLTAAALGIDLELKQIDLFGREQLDPEFIKVSVRVKFSVL